MELVRVSTGDPVACVGAQRERIRLNLQLFADMRTEPATPRRRQEARRKGQVARTGELSSALVLLAGFGALIAAILAFLGIRQAGQLQAERTWERYR